MGKRSDRKKLGTGKAAAYLLVSVLGVSAAAPLTAAAAPVSGQGSISVEEEVLSLELGKTGSLTVDYDLAGGFADLAVLTADPSIAAAVLTDNGDGSGGGAGDNHRSGLSDQQCGGRGLCDDPQRPGTGRGRLYPNGRDVAGDGL